VLLGNKGTLPTTWGTSDVEIRKLYCQEMCLCFPELRLCDLDWKVEQIATDNYPSWHSTWDAKATHQIIKTEGSPAPQMKRVHGESMTTPSLSKQLKVKRDKDNTSFKQDMDDITINPLPPHILTVGNSSVSPDLMLGTII
jgi:hypothetical protein